MVFLSILVFSSKFMALEYISSSLKCRSDAILNHLIASRLASSRIVKAVFILSFSKSDDPYENELASIVNFSGFKVIASRLSGKNTASVKSSERG